MEYSILILTFFPLFNHFFDLISGFVIFLLEIRYRKHEIVPMITVFPPRMICLVYSADFGSIR